eukprot:CAMPEP_0196138522 /NCGR_PEP_ID=MMETSP0910-20130528/6134_1 /TAXON_ID=49265 /ORGANISM="Thalassiosira rotula, Strain GSO102" /LENGTH=82 /DNA_ID=CAMNT_0041399135 /DNA_START=896 /DNA_END=1144 /DNA_ORIENTATION=+
MARWPMVTPSPIVNGIPESACNTAPSCTFVLSPTVMGSGLSPRMVALNQTDDCSFMITLPTTAALGATQQDAAILGTYEPNA